MPVENCSIKIRARPIDSLVREISYVHQLSGACPCRVSAIDISREGKWNEHLISYGGRAGVLPANDMPIKRNAPVRETLRDAAHEIVPEITFFRISSLFPAKNIGMET